MRASKKIIIVSLVLSIVALPALSQAIHEAVKNGDFAKVKILLEKNNKIVNLKDSNNNTPLHIAADGGYKEIAELLVENGAEINAKNVYGHTPLHLAVFSNQENMVSFMIAKRAKIDIKNAFSLTPLQLVAQQTGNVEIAKLLIHNGADINIKNDFGEPPITSAAWMGFREFVNLLIDKGAEIPKTGRKNRDMVMFAASEGLVKLFKLLDEMDANMEIMNSNGGTLLHSACSGGSQEITKLLIAKGFDLNIRDRYGWTPLHYASHKGHKVIIEILLDNKADPNVRTLSGKTPFNIAEKKEEKEYRDITELLISKGADQSPQKFPVLESEYLGQKTPGSKPEIFAKDMVSSNRSEHSCVTFSPDGKEVYWSSVLNNEFKILSMKIEGNKWTAPHLASFSKNSDYLDDGPSFSPDGKRLFFISRRPIDNKEKAAKGNIWLIEKTKNGWSEPVPISSAVNSMNLHFQMSVSNDLSIYFDAWEDDGEGKYDIYRSEFINGEYSQPENLGKMINTEFSDGTPYIAPDESYLIFSRLDHPDGFGGSDLYISYRGKDGSWMEPKNLGNTINTEEYENLPIVSPDGKYLFFRSYRNGNNDIYWVDAKIIEDLKPKELKENTLVY